MLYYPWPNEDIDVLGNYETYEERYNHVQDVVIDNESKYNEIPDNNAEYIMRMVHQSI